MVRFLQLFERGGGDYTRDREKWLGKVSVRGLTEKIRDRCG
jgi:hypothetical protein